MWGITTSTAGLLASIAARAAGRLSRSALCRVSGSRVAGKAHLPSVKTTAYSCVKAERSRPSNSAEVRP
eukprot:1312898-Alexandrium_andersonii.AAC.1